MQNYRFKVVLAIKESLDNEQKAKAQADITYWAERIGLTKIDDITYIAKKIDNTELGVARIFFLKMKDYFVHYLSKLEYYNYTNGYNEVAV